MSRHGQFTAGYDNTHRAFLQALLARQSFTFAEAKPLLAAIHTARDRDRPTQAEDISREDFEHHVHALNGAISPFDLQVCGALHQRTGEEVFALVNTASDALTQMATSHSADEIAFVNRVLDAMFDAHNTRDAEVLAVTGTQALKLVRPARAEGAARRDSGTQGAAPMTMTQAEKVLDSMVREGWFELSQSGFYSLSPRALMELRGWLVDTYNDQPDEEEDEEEDDNGCIRIKICAACKGIVTVGQRCPDRDCLGRLHHHCVGRMFRAQGNAEICPVCKACWRNPLPVGEEAARVGRHSHHVNGTGGRRSSNGLMNGANDDEDESD